MSKEDITDELKVIKNEQESIKAQIDEIKKFLEVFNPDREELVQNKDKIDEIINGVEKKQTSINELYKKILDHVANKTQELQQIVHSANERSNELATASQTLELNLKRFKELKKEIDDLHSTLLIDGEDGEGGEASESVQSAILNTQKSMNDLLKKTREEAETLKKELEKEIRSLLPGAGAAGLASTYSQAKARYGDIPYAGDTKGIWGWVKSLGFFLKSNTRSFLNYLFFIGPLLFLVLYFLGLFDGPLSIDPEEDLTMETLFLRFLISTPLIAISFFGWSSIRLQRRLYEEYNHKQRVMQLYHSFMEQVNKEGTEEHKQKLLSIMLKTVSDKPALAMNEYDKGTPSLLQSLFPAKKKSDTQKNQRNETDGSA